MPMETGLDGGRRRAGGTKQTTTSRKLLLRSPRTNRPGREAEIEREREREQRDNTAWEAIIMRVELLKKDGEEGRKGIFPSLFIGQPLFLALSKADELGKLQLCQTLGL